MKVLFSIYFILIVACFSFSYELGGAFSLDYYNNPVEKSAPSPFQEKLVAIHSFDISYFNLRSGIGILRSYYEIQEDVPVFGDYWSGFHTVEFDLFTYPGFSINIGDKVNVGLSGGGGVRLPVVSEVDKDLEIDHSEAFNWFYKDLHFLFVSGSLFSRINLPLAGDSIKLFLSCNYTNFLTRGDHWTIGATAGLLWQIN